MANHPVERLDDLVLVDLPELGAQLVRNNAAALVEPVKAVSDVHCPLNGEDVEVNEAMLDDPSMVNSDAQGAGWFFKLKRANAADARVLMDEAAYLSLVGRGHPDRQRKQSRPL